MLDHDRRRKHQPIGVSRARHTEICDEALVFRRSRLRREVWFRCCRDVKVLNVGRSRGDNAMNELVGLEATVTNPTRGADGPGEVDIPYKGVYIAYSDEPLSRGTEVVIYQELGARKVRVTAVR
jgi:hypothetical protein